MRPAKGFVLISVTVALAVLAATLWYLYVVSEREKQHMLEQAAQEFLEKYKDGRFPAPLTAAEIWRAQERVASATDPMPPLGSAPERARMGPIAQLAQAQANAPRGGLFDTHGVALLTSALLVLGVTAIGFAGTTYRLHKQSGRIRTERDYLAQQLNSAQTGEPKGRTAPPWQEGALMMVRASTVPAVAYDLDARVLEVSESFTRLTGYTRVDMPDVKAWFTKLLRTPEAELEAALESFRTKVHSGDIETRTVWTTSGEPRTWLCQPLEVWPLEGDGLLLVARATDITAETEAANAASAEAAALRAALAESDRPGAEAAAVPPASSSREAELTTQLAGRTEECRQLTARVRTLEEQLTAERTQAEAARSKEAERARRAESLADERRQVNMVLEAAYQAAGTGLCVFDTNLHLVSANECWRRMAREVGDEKTALAVIGPCVRDALQTRAPAHRASVQARGPGGEERTWRLDCRPVAGSDGALSALVVTADDITQYAARITSLKEVLERFQLFAEQFEDSLWLADPRVPRLIYATEQAARLRGRPLARMTEEFSEWTAAIHEEDRERVREAFSAAAVEGSYDVEYRVVRDDGSIVWLHDRAIAVHDAQKRLRYLAGITADVTVRRNATDMMQRTLAILRSLVDHTPAIVWMKDGQGRYVYANREYAKRTGFSPEQLCGRTDFQIFPRAVAERLQEHDARALASNGQQFEETLQLAGGPHHFVTLKYPARDPEAPAGALCGIGMDISERRRGEDTLRVEESRYRAIAASLPQALLIAREGRVVYANSAAAELLGGADDNPLAGLPLQELVASAEPALVEAAKALAAGEAGARRFPARLKARDGRELECEVSAAAYETATERAVQLVVQDVGEQNARLRALKEAEAFFHGLCDSASTAVRLVDADGRLVFSNRRWEALTGAAAAGDWYAQVHPDDRSLVRGRYASPLRRDESACLEYRLRDASGRERWVLDSLVPRYDGHGQWQGCLSSMVDISERKRTEEALRAHRDDLARLLDRCPAPVWVSDARGSGYANQACLAWLGARLDGNGNFDILEHLHAEDRDSWLDTRARHVNDGNPLKTELRLRRSDGEYRNVQIAAVPAGAAGSNDTRLVGFLNDVTDLRRTAQALSVAAQRRAQVIEVLASAHSEELAQVRRTAELVRVMFPDEAQLQKVTQTVLSESERLEALVEEMLVPLRSRQDAHA